MSTRETKLPPGHYPKHLGQGQITMLTTGPLNTSNGYKIDINNALFPKTSVGR